MDRNILIALGAAVLFMAGLVFEIAGFLVPGWHSISWYAYHFQPLRVSILLAILFGAGLWWWHSGAVPGR